MNRRKVRHVLRALSLARQADSYELVGLTEMHDDRVFAARQWLAFGAGWTP